MNAQEHATALLMGAGHLPPNIAISLTLGFALLLGLLVGYERTYHGRAVGMRTYGLVCMSSAALTAFVGYPELWYGGSHPFDANSVDPTRVVGGIVTGVGFLGAGLIIKDGLNIRGLTTAASVWSSSVIGILVGAGFFIAATVLSVLSMLCMLWVHRLEKWLPSQSSLAVTLVFRQGKTPTEHEFEQAVHKYGYEVVPGSLSIHLSNGIAEWRFIVNAQERRRHSSIVELARVMSEHDRLENFQLAHSRN